MLNNQIVSFIYLLLLFFGVVIFSFRAELCWGHQLLAETKSLCITYFQNGALRRSNQWQA